MCLYPMSSSALVAVLVAFALATFGVPEAAGAGVAPALEWAAVQGIGTYDQALDVATARDGTVYISGQTDDDFFAASYNPDRSFRWSSFGDRGYAAGVAAGPAGSAFAVGASTSDSDSEAFLTRFRPDGRRQWTVYLGGQLGDAARDVAYRAGYVYIVGDTEGPSLTARNVRGDADIFVARYSAAGRLDWLRLLHVAAGYDSGQGIAVTHDAIFITGFSGDGDAVAARYSLQGRRIWLRRLAGTNADGSRSLDSARSIAATDKAVFVGGNTDSTGTFGGQPVLGGRDAFIARMTPDGATEWLRLVGGPEREALTGVAVAAGRLYGTGIAFGSSFLDQPVQSDADLYLVELSVGGGQVQSALTLTGNKCPAPGYTYGQGVAAAPDGAIYVAGDSLCKYFEDQPVCVGTDAILVKFAHVPAGRTSAALPPARDPCKPVK